MRVFKLFVSLFRFGTHEFLGRTAPGPETHVKGMETALFDGGLVGFGGKNARRRTEMKKTCTGRRLRRGMTLTEVVISTAIILIVLASSYVLVVRAAELSRSARRHYIAISLAKNRIERARNFLYDDLKLMAESDLTVNDNGNPDPNGRFRRTTNVNTNFAAGLTEVIVTVKIRNPHTGLFTPDNESIRTLFTEYLEP